MMLMSHKIVTTGKCRALHCNGSTFSTRLADRIVDIATICQNELYWGLSDENGYVFKDDEGILHCYFPDDAMYGSEMNTFEEALVKLCRQGLPLATCFDILCL